jgi:nucleotide-binding universal stress UspA family protein
LGQRLTTAGLEARVEQLNDANVKNLVDKCDEWEADFIVVGSHQHSAFYHWLVGSVTVDVLRSSRCPVLVVPA